MKQAARWLALLSLLAGCSGEEENASPSSAAGASGQGGAAGQGGSAGKGGSAGATAGKGGQAGQAGPGGAGLSGNSGQSGGPTAGSAGKGGAAGTGAGNGGAGGQSGGQGGAGASPGGSAGSANTAGSAGSAGGGTAGQAAGAQQGGEGGASGQAGEGGQTGQAGEGGAAGEAGQAGQGGAGGEGPGGAGQAGSGGQGGAGSGGQGGAGQAGAGEGGGGDAGSAGQAGAPVDPPGTWRSALYPQGWKPPHEGGQADDQGRFLHDFSYAGYHRGEQRPPHGQGTVVATVDAAAGDGVSDATAAIQKAIDDGCAKGGGVVLLPAGLYRIKLPSSNAAAAIRIACSKLVLRGEGPTQSRLLLDDAKRMRDRSAISIRPTSGSVWDNANTKIYPLTGDTKAGDASVAVADAAGLAAGDWVAVRNEVTPELRVEHRMDGASNGSGSDWWPSSQFRGLVYPRQITKIEGAVVTLDAPTRYPLKTRDKARLYRLPAGYLEENGIEDLGIGAVQSATGSTPGSESASDDDYTTAGTTGYEVHASRFIDVGAARDGWVHNVRSFIPAENQASGFHLLSHGIQLAVDSFRFTIDQCDLGRPQYRGGGGNGYLYHLQGHDHLLHDDRATSARHGFILNQASSGNVFLRSTTTTSRLTDDAHRFLAQANLYDGMRLEKTWLSCVNRGSTSSGAGFTATEHVFWNTQVIENHGSAKGCAVETAQWGWGYVIGTSAPAGQSAKICTAAVTNSTWAQLDQGDPPDFTEGEGQGAALYPPSLYDDQRARRCALPGVACDP